MNYISMDYICISIYFMQPAIGEWARADAFPEQIVTDHFNLPAAQRRGPLLFWTSHVVPEKQSSVAPSVKCVLASQFSACSTPHSTTYYTIELYGTASATFLDIYLCHLTTLSCTEKIPSMDPSSITDLDNINIIHSNHIPNRMAFHFDIG